MAFVLIIRCLLFRGMAFSDSTHCFFGFGAIFFVSGTSTKSPPIYFCHIRKKGMQQCWVYIIRNQEGFLSIKFSSGIKASLSDLMQGRDSILYLRPFLIPFDALAHKHLLDNLSGETIRQFIRKNRQITKIYIRALLKKIL